MAAMTVDWKVWLLMENSWVVQTDELWAKRMDAEKVVTKVVSKEVRMVCEKAAKTVVEKVKTTARLSVEWMAEPTVGWTAALMVLVTAKTLSEQKSVHTLVSWMACKLELQWGGRWAYMTELTTGYSST